MYSRQSLKRIFQDKFGRCVSGWKAYCVEVCEVVQGWIVLRRRIPLWRGFQNLSWHALDVCGHLEVKDWCRSNINIIQFSRVDCINDGSGVLQPDSASNSISAHYYYHWPANIDVVSSLFILLSLSLIISSFIICCIYVILILLRIGTICTSWSSLDHKWHVLVFLSWLVLFDLLEVQIFSSWEIPRKSSNQRLPDN